MSRTMFAIAFAGLIIAAAPGTSHAAPIVPLSAAAAADLNNVTDVQWGRRCWRDRWGPSALSRRWLGSSLLVG